jgi:hypothetical protein
MGFKFFDNPPNSYDISPAFSSLYCDGPTRKLLYSITGARKGEKEIGILPNASFIKYVADRIQI